MAAADDEKTGLSRRAFMLASGAALASGCLEVDGTWPDEGSALCTTSDPRVTMSFPAQAGRVVEHLNQALVVTASGQRPRVVEAEAARSLKTVLLALAGKPDLKAAWASILVGYKPGQVVGVKVNVLGKVPTHLELVKALVDLLKTGVGLKPEEILVWDRRLDELTSAGLTAKALGCRVEGTYDSTSGKGTGRGYELTPVCINGRNAKLSNIQTRAVDHLINFAVMKNHGESGYTGCLKNHFGTIHNPEEFHNKKSGTGSVIERRIDGALVGINARDEVAKKARLWLLDAAIGVCKGDTQDDADCVPRRIAASLDPLAIDVRGRQIRDQEAKGATTETASSSWIQAVERSGLGKSKIKLEPVS